MCFRPARVPEGLAAGQGVGDLGRVVGDAGRPPHVRHRVGVARVVLRVRPFGAEVDDVRDERLVELEERALGEECRDVHRDRERQVVAAAVVAELRVGLVRVREEVVRDLDAVLLLERGDRRVADVLGPVVDEQLAFGRGHRRRLDRCDGARRGGTRSHRRPQPRQRRTGWGRLLRTRRSQARGRPRVRTCATLEQLAAADPPLDHVADQRLLQVDAGSVVSLASCSLLLFGSAGSAAQDERVGRRPGDGDLVAGRESDPGRWQEDGQVQAAVGDDLVGHGGSQVRGLIDASADGALGIRRDEADRLGPDAQFDLAPGCQPIVDTRGDLAGH